MATRKIKDAKDLSTNELIYFKGHAKATYMSDGKTVEDAINQIGTGGGGSGITVETDPIFSASPAASITEEKKAEWDEKYTKPSGGIPKTDLASAVQTSLGKADTALQSHQDISGKQDKLVSGTNIKTINGEPILGSGDITIKGGSDVEVPTKVSQLENDAEYITHEDVAAVALSGSYKDLQDTPTIPTKTSELANDNGLIDEQTLSTTLEDYTLNDAGYAVADGLRDSDDTIFYLPSTAPEDTDRMLLTNGSLKTINGQSIVGSGNIEISGGEGGGSSSDGRKEVIYVDMESTITSMRPNVIYWILGFWDVSIESFEEPVYGVETYDVFTAIIELGQNSSDTLSFTLPDYVMWANGVIPELVEGTYELSISRISDGDYTQYHAVLTPFKYV